MIKNSRCFSASTFSLSALSVTAVALAGVFSTGCVANAVADASSTDDAPSTQTVNASAASSSGDIASTSAPTAPAQAIALGEEDKTALPKADTSEIDPSDAYVDEIDPSDAYSRDAGRIDAQGNLLPEIIDGLTVGMPYDEARELIMNGIWLPRTYPPVSTDNLGVVALQEMGFEEARECSGTGLGLCRLEFVEREGLLFGVVVTTSEAMPTVWSWFVE